jgi:hypothetical protein
MNPNSFPKHPVPDPTGWFMPPLGRCVLNMYTSTQDNNYSTTIFRIYSYVSAQSVKNVATFQVHVGYRDPQILAFLVFQQEGIGTLFMYEGLNTKLQENMPKIESRK